MFFLTSSFYNLDAPGLSNTIRLCCILCLRNVCVAAEDAQRKHVYALLDWVYLRLKLWVRNYPTGFFLGFRPDRHTKRLHDAASFARKHHFKNHSRTLVSRGMPLNKQTHQPSFAINMSHVDKTPVGTEMPRICFPNGTRWGTMGLDVHCCVAGSIPRLSFTAGSLITFSGWRRLEMLHSDPVKKNTWPGFAC